MTPGFALDFLRASLMTLVSTKYTGCRPLGLDALEVRVGADIGNRSQQLRQSALAWARESLGQYLSMFRLGASAVRASALLERLDERLIDTANEQVRHVGTSGNLRYQ
jgi:hypothetical protein